MADEKKIFKKRRWHEPFITALSKFGTVSTACSLSGISRQTYYRETEHPQFKAMCADAEQGHRDLLLLKITNFAMREGTASQTSLQALQFLINRADRRLQEQDRAGQLAIPQGGDDTSITIKVDESVAKRLFPRMLELHRAAQNAQFPDISETDDDTKKPN